MSSIETFVHLVRHGEVDNPDGVVYERLPGYPLSSLGREMAEAAAAALAGHPVTYLRSSPLLRAQQTAEPIARMLGCDLRVDERLTEASHKLAGQRVAMNLNALRNPLRWMAFRNPFRPSWGEPYEQVAARMAGALNAALTVAYGQHAVLVSHQLPIWTLRRHCQRQRLWHDPRRRECALASITSLKFVGSQLESVTYGSEHVGATAACTVD